MKKYWAEFIGTFFIIWFGCGSICLSHAHPEQMNSALVPVIFGVSVAAMIYTVGHISGAHFNPGVTIAFWISRNFSGKDVVAYIASQMFGALSAIIFLRIFFEKQFVAFCLTHSQLSLEGTGFIEFLISFILMFVIASVATDTRAEGEFAGLAIGMIVFLSAAVFGPLTGASMNPARSLAPAFIMQDYHQILIYMLAPISGTITGAFAYKKLKD